MLVCRVGHFLAIELQRPKMRELFGGGEIDASHRACSEQSAAVEAHVRFHCGLAHCLGCVAAAYVACPQFRGIEKQNHCGDASQTQPSCNLASRTPFASHRRRLWVKFPVSTERAEMTETENNFQRVSIPA